MKPEIGLISIGQSPRPDIVQEIKKAMAENPKIIEVGALDGLSRNEILSLGCSPQDYRVVTRLSDAQPITISKNHILARMETALRKLESQSVRFAAILCTEEFPEYPFDGLLLKPGKLLFHFVSSFYRKDGGAIVIPLEEQKEAATKRWKLPNVHLNIGILAPGPNPDAIERLCEELRREPPGFVVLDCFGYDGKLKREIQHQLNCPVILPRTLLGYALREMVGE